VKLVFTAAAWADYVEWQDADPAIAARINLLIGECLPRPFTGTGKPEPLKRNLSGWWSRRVDRLHRLVYRVSGSGEGQALEILSCRYHY
jgi:toxin YoeB